MLQHRIKSAPLPWQSSDIKSWWWLNICTYEIYIHICCINYTCWQVAGRSDTGMDWVLKSKHIPQALSCWISSQGAAGSHVWHVNIIVGIPTNGDCCLSAIHPQDQKRSAYISTKKSIGFGFLGLPSWRLGLGFSFTCLSFAWLTFLLTFLLLTFLLLFFLDRSTHQIRVLLFVLLGIPDGCSCQVQSCAPCSFAEVLTES